LREKYGMEFRKPKWEETPDDGLIAGHAWKIFPVLHRRYLFADVENFFLYDLLTANGSVDENVFAYSNVHQDERGLVVYHNRFADTAGWIKNSAAYLDKNTGDLRQKSLAEALGLPFEGYVIFKDYVTHLEYIRSCEELWQKGMFLELQAYQHNVFMDWRFVEDSNWELVQSALNGAGVESMQAQWDEMFGLKEEAVEEEKVKKPRKRAVVKKAGTTKKTATKKEAKDSAKKKEPAVRKSKKKIEASDTSAPENEERTSKKE
ncbi:MAG TPA: hypothetical protein VFL47_09775, partial [Flavisolibacter sp.]|nr:hypothetical protein [Flavisolibacter sp.]